MAKKRIFRTLISLIQIQTAAFSVFKAVFPRRLLHFVTSYYHVGQETYLLDFDYHDLCNLGNWKIDSIQSEQASCEHDSHSEIFFPVPPNPIGNAERKGRGVVGISMEARRDTNPNVGKEMWLLPLPQLMNMYLSTVSPLCLNMREVKHKISYPYCRSKLQK